MKLTPKKRFSNDEPPTITTIEELADYVYLNGKTTADNTYGFCGIVINVLLKSYFNTRIANKFTQSVREIIYRKVENETHEISN